jgi:hypothetical protein
MAALIFKNFVKPSPNTNAATAINMTIMGLADLRLVGEEAGEEAEEEKEN